MCIFKCSAFTLTIAGVLFSDDDIFADVSSKSKPKTKKSPKPSSAATKSASIFDEDSPSIFDDPLNALGH